MFYILATVVVGNEVDEVICEFQNSQKMRKFAREVMSGAKALPVWRKISDTHPQSGEPSLIRSRRFINGNLVLSMEVVQPKQDFADTHGYDPNRFEPVPEIKSQGYGFWTCPPDDAPEGAVVGARYAVKRDAVDQRRYVTLRVAEGDAPERRHYLDAERGGHSESLGAYDDDERDDIDFGDDDEDLW